jgi:hypothetical protein
MLEPFLLCLLDRVTQPLDIVERAEVVDIRELRAGDRQMHRRHPRRQQQSVERNPLPVRQRHHAPRHVQVRCANAGAQLDPLLGIPPRRLDEQLLARRAFSQVRLRERRPMVRPDRFAPDHGQLALRIDRANRLRRGRPSQPAPDDQVFHVKHAHNIGTQPIVRFPRAAGAPFPGIGRWRSRRNHQNVQSRDQSTRRRAPINCHRDQVCFWRMPRPGGTLPGGRAGTSGG